MKRRFKVGVTRDFLGSDGETVAWGNIGLDRLSEVSWLEWEFLQEDAAVLDAQLVEGYDALLLNGPLLTADVIASLDSLQIVARFGVGFDNVDVQACAERGIAVTNTPDGVRRPVASSVLCLLLALGHRLLDKDRITRMGRWDDRMGMMGRSLTGSTIGLIGYGNIGREVSRLLEPLDVRLLVSDPYISEADRRRASSHIEFSTQIETLRRSDFVVLLCPLTQETYHLVSTDELAAMRPNGYLINVSRGRVVDQVALVSALKAGQIAGAALDVFESEPLEQRAEILTLDNVIVTPHSLCWNDEMAAGCGNSAIKSILDFAQGRQPANLVNRAVIEHRRYQATLAENASRSR